MLRSPSIQQDPPPTDFSVALRSIGRRPPHLHIRTAGQKLAFVQGWYVEQSTVDQLRELTHMGRLSMMSDTKQEEYLSADAEKQSEGPSVTVYEERRSPFQNEWTRKLLSWGVEERGNHHF